MFTHSDTIRLRDTDTAGVRFFARQFDLMHDAFEEFMLSRGVSVPYILHEAPYSLAIVHAEGDYTAPVRIGDVITVEVRVEKVGAKSFTMGYAQRNSAGVDVGAGRTVHVTLDKSTREAIEIPSELRGALESAWR